MDILLDCEVMRGIFENTENAFALKSDSELERAYFLFKLVSREPLVKIGSAATRWAIDAHLPVEALIRSTVFDHFCGGVDEEDCIPVVDKLYTKRVHSVLDYSVEGKEEKAQFDHALETTLRVLEFVKSKEAIPFAVFKPTGFGRLELFERKGGGEPLSAREHEEWEEIRDRYDRVFEKANEMGLSVLVDAEETWMQDGADELALEMMQKYNGDKPVIFNTIQFYRKDSVDLLKRWIQWARNRGVKIGIKAVRGAYMEKERERAREMGYESPICETKADSDRLFDEGCRLMIENREVCHLYAGTHNEESCYTIVEIMSELGLKPDTPEIWFGQLFGMSDHISFNLARYGYNVSKYLPFGPVRDVMPYLIRRAEENTSVAGQTSRELSLLQKERARRKLIKKGVNSDPAAV